MAVSYRAQPSGGAMIATAPVRSAGTVVTSTLAALLAIGATMLTWRSTLADLGHRLPVRAAAQINLVGQLAKYLPGTVWAYVLQAELGRRFGVPRSRSLLASLVS